MATEINIPSLGEGIDGGDIVTLHVAVGDTVTADQPLLELETGKATVDVPAPADGVISRLDVAEGDKVAIGDVIGALDSGAAEAAPTPEAAPEADVETVALEDEPEEAEEESSADRAVVNILIPNLGEGVDGGNVITVHVTAGQEVDADQSLLELETGKATVDIPAPAAGTILELHLAEGDTGEVGTIVGTMEVAGTVPKTSAPKKKAGANAPAVPQPPSATPSKPAPQLPLLAAAERPAHAPVPAAPSVRKFAREIGVDILQVPGNGPGGRISLADVKTWSKQLHQTQSAAPAGAIAAVRKQPPLPDFATFGEIDREKMSTIRKMTVEHMDNCWSTIPHVTQFDSVDVTDIEALRKTFQPKAKAAGTKLTMTAMLIKILGSALKAFPNFNASIDLENEEVVYKKYFNVGCAVDTPKGLVVPVVRDVDSLNMIEISKALGDMAGRMRDGKISPAELQGGCITLSNLGGLMGKHFTPIVNGPEVAILGVGRASMQPVWQDGQFVPRMMMPLSLSYDHRLIDGADGTRFLRWIVEAIEQPLLISLEG